MKNIQKVRQAIGHNIDSERAEEAAAIMDRIDNNTYTSADIRRCAELGREGSVARCHFDRRGGVK